jgi:DNA processing protein
VGIVLAAMLFMRRMALVTETKLVEGSEQRLPGPVPPRLALSDAAALHGRILSRLGPSPVAEDQLIRDMALPAAQIAPELLALELDGKILRQAGGLLSRAGDGPRL